MKDIIEWGILFYLIILFIMVISGFNDISKNYTRYCGNQTNIEYFFPGHQIGCWLGDNK